MAFALAAAMAGCREPRPHCAVTHVAVGEGLSEARMDALGVSREDLRRAALEALAATRGFEVPGKEPARAARPCRATVALLDARAGMQAVPDAPPDSAVLRVDVAVELELSFPAGQEKTHEAARWSEPVKQGEKPEAALHRAIAGASRKAASALALALSEAEKTDAELIRDLEAGDARLRDYAVRVLAGRRSPAAVPALVTRLRDPDPEVVERAVGALAEIRDRRAVEPLIELTQRREGPFVAQLVRIIGDIGGSEAEAFLGTLAAGHPEPMVREAAREALVEARRRASRSAPAAR
jgi:hypothetical protein